MKKGQLFSLDLLIALAVIVFGLGLMIQFSETKIYDQKEKQLRNELEAVGRTASMLLVSNPEIICELTYGGGTTISFLENCIDTAAINSTSLGIPSGYDYRVFDASDTTLAGSAIPVGAKNVFAEKRIVATKSGSLTKQELEICMEAGACPLTQGEITIAVWRA